MDIFSALTQRYWAIDPDNLQQMAQIALRMNDKELWLKMQEETAPEAVQGKMLPLMQGTRGVEIKDRIGILSLTGPIFPKANMMMQMSGATSLHVFSHDFHVALESEEIDAIVLDIDSPGGVAFGPGEMADIIAKGRAVKPIVAYVSGMACSAAYWIASAASEIVAHRSSELGSIGVVAGVPVQENPDSDGYRVIEIVSSNARNKRPDPRTDEGKEQIRTALDGIETEFIRSVAENRKVSVEHVIKYFGEGGVMIAGAAVKAGMADRIGSFEDVISGLTSPKRKPNSTSLKGKPMSTKEKSEADVSVVTAESIKADHPEIYAQIQQEARASALAEGIVKGAEQERSRITSLERLARPGSEKLLAEAKADGKTTYEELCVKLVEKDKNIGADYINQMTTASANTPEIKPSVDISGASIPSVSASAPVEERAKAEWDNNTQVRLGYPNFAAFLGFKKAEEGGRFRLKSSSK